MPAGTIVVKTVAGNSCTNYPPPFRKQTLVVKPTANTLLVKGKRCIAVLAGYAPVPRMAASQLCGVSNIGSNGCTGFKIIILGSVEKIWYKWGHHPYVPNPANRTLKQD